MIKKLDKENEKELNQFINKNPNSKYQHTINFKNLIEKTYRNCKPFYFFSADNNKIKTLFPFFLVKSRLLGNRFISQPFMDNGGFLGDTSKKDLKQIIKEIKKEKKIKSIEIRLCSIMQDFDKTKKILKQLKFTEDVSHKQFIIKLDSEQEMFEKLHRDTKKDLRRAKENKLYIKEAKTKDELKDFYNLYFKRMKEFGTPPHSYLFFENLFENKENFVLLNAYQEERIVAGFIILFEKDYGYNPINIYDPNFRKIRPSDFVYWESIKWSIKKGLKYLDLGQVNSNAEKGTHAWGIYKFKEKWLGDLYDRSYFRLNLFNSSSTPEHKKNKLKKLSSVWTYLPNILIRIIGPKIRGQIGV